MTPPVYMYNFQELEEQMEDLLAPLRKLQAVKHIKKEDEEDLKRFCNSK